MKNVLIRIILVCIFLVYSVVAQTEETRTIIRGVLNSKAESLPVPVYPPAARAVGAWGTVNVEIIIDTDGTVSSAQAVSGHPLLRVASQTAARNARFKPTLLNGTPAKIAGVLVFLFPCPFEDAPRCSETNEALTRVKPAETSDGNDDKVGAQLPNAVVNGKAISLPAPVYPASAAAVNAAGEVEVQVLIDETGKVVSAAAVSGHPLLRSASEKAALEARFHPTLLENRPVKVSGIIKYVFNSRNSNTASGNSMTLAGLGAALEMLRHKPVKDYTKNDRFFLTAMKMFSVSPKLKGIFDPLNSFKETTTDSEAEVMFQSVLENINSRLEVSDSFKFGFGRKAAEIKRLLREQPLNESELRSKLGAFELSLAFIEKDVPAEFAMKVKEMSTFADREDLSTTETQAELRRVAAEVFAFIFRDIPYSDK